MKTKYIETDHLQRVWLVGVETLLFPSALIKELCPQDIIDMWGDDLPVKRERHRDGVDVLIVKLIDFHRPEDILKILRETDRTIVALYFDRIAAASFALDEICRETRATEIPESWETLVRLLLLQRPFQ